MQVPLHPRPSITPNTCAYRWSPRLGRNPAKTTARRGIIPSSQVSDKTWTHYCRVYLIVSHYCTNVLYYMEKYKYEQS